jgi:hypothetical protein
VQENQVGLKLNSTHQLLAYADYVNVLEDDIDTIKKNILGTSIDGSNEAGLERNLLSSLLLSKNLKIRIILPVVLYGCVTWSLTLREEHRLRVFENRVLRRIFEPKRDEVTGQWRKLRNEELHDLYSLPSII